MKIEHTDSSKTDTDKLPDIDAQVLELSEQLRQLCENNHRPFAMVISHGGNDKFYAFWNIKGRTNISEKGIDIGPMISSMNVLVGEMTHGGLSIKQNE
jgi:hypothetical protein